MSTPVDVLAVMQEAELALQDFNCSVTWDKVRKARAAVAELIEAATRLHDRAEFEGFGRDASAEMDAVNTALARVKGGAA